MKLSWRRHAREYANVGEYLEATDPARRQRLLAMCDEIDRVNRDYYAAWGDWLAAMHRDMAAMLGMTVEELEELGQ